MPRVTVVPLLSATMLLAGGVPHHCRAAEGRGTIRGRLVHDGDKIPVPKPTTAKLDAAAKVGAICATTSASQPLVVDPKTKGVRFGVAFVAGLNEEETPPPARKEVAIEVKGCEFVPRVTAVRAGQSVALVASDPITHGIFSPGLADGSLVPLFPGKKSVHRVEASGSRPHALSCDLHSWMEGRLWVFDHPYFATTAPDGSFEIKDVPAGPRRIVVWHETGYATPGGRAGMEVLVKAGEVVDLGEIKVRPRD